MMLFGEEHVSLEFIRMTQPQRGVNYFCIVESKPKERNGGKRMK